MLILWVDKIISSFITKVVGGLKMKKEITVVMERKGVRFIAIAFAIFIIAMAYARYSKSIDGITVLSEMGTIALASIGILTIAFYGYSFEGKKKILTFSIAVMAIYVLLEIFDKNPAKMITHIPWILGTPELIVVGVLVVIEYFVARANEDNLLEIFRENLKELLGDLNIGITTTRSGSEDQKVLLRLLKTKPEMVCQMVLSYVVRKVPPSKTSKDGISVYWFVKNSKQKATLTVKNLNLTPDPNVKQ
jgi:hypothetical protein